MIQIKEFADQLTAIPEKEFTHANVLNFLRRNPVEPASLNPYLYFCKEKDHYTRNLIHKTELFELIAICWDIGQKSPIHNHRDRSSQASICICRGTACRALGEQVGAKGSAAVPLHC